MGLFDTLSTISHDSEKGLCLKVGDHQHLDVISLNLINRLVCTENALLLDLFGQDLQAFDASLEVRLCAVLIVIVPSHIEFKLGEEVYDVHTLEVNLCDRL